MRAVPTQIAVKLPAAAELFAERGLDNTKIEDVAAATGVAKATLYYYFSGKEEILAFLLQDVLTQIADEVAIAVQAPDRTAAERLAAVIRAQLSVMAAQPAVGRALIGDLGRAGRIPEIATAIRDAYYGPIEGLLAEGARDGSLAPQDDPVAAAAALLGAVTISGLTHLVADSPLDPDAVAAAVLRVVFTGLRPR
jgi:TetR/AcrR family transcriptional regulator